MNLAELNRVRANDPRVVDLMLPEVGGGRLTPGQLAQVEQRPNADVLRVSGLDQATFELLVEQYGPQFKAIHFWKCPRVADLSALEDLPHLTHVAYYWNQRALRLWDLSKTPELRGLQFKDFTRLRRLDDVAVGSGLEELEFGDEIWPKNSFETLEPISSLSKLRRLSLSPKRIDDGRVQPLAALASLEDFDAPSNLFTTEQLAWLRARLRVEGGVLQAVIEIDPPLQRDEGRPPWDTLVMGKRKPFLNASADEKRLSRYVTAFEHLVEAFRDDASLEPQPT